MRPRDRSLIDEIERESLDSSVPLADVLRKLLALGGHAGSSELREWASRELSGYPGDVELPDYRKPAAQIKIDGFTINAQIRGQAISVRALPDVVREVVGEYVPLRHSVGEIEAMAEQAKAEGGYLRLVLPGGQDVVAMMNRQHEEYGQNISSVYWSLSITGIRGAIDQIRTSLVQLVAEMKATMPPTVETPPADVADQAVQVVVHGKKSQVTVTAAQASGDGSHEVHAAPPSTDGGWSWRRIGAAVAGLASIAGAVIGVAAWQGWGL